MKKTLTICSLVVALFLTGCSSTINQEENNTNTTAQTQNQGSNKQKEEDLKKYVQYEAFETETSELIVVATNTSDQSIGTIQAEVTFYKDGAMLDTSEEALYDILPGQKVVFDLYKPTDSNYDVAEYDNYEVSIKTDSFGVAKNLLNNITIEHSIGSDGIIIRCTNNEEEPVTYEKFKVLFYQNNVVVGSSLAIDTETLQKGDFVTLKADIPYNRKTIDPIAYDTYEVVPCEITNL